MGLDQFAYVAAKARQREEFYEEGDYDSESETFKNPKVSAPREIAYWRKHPNLQGWMERLWLKKIDVSRNASDQFYQDKHPPHEFNGVELELTWEDLDQLEKDILSGKMSKLDTQGFFFGSPSDDYYKDKDLKFIKDAKAEVFLGLKVFYNSSW